MIGSAWPCPTPTLPGEVAGLVTEVVAGGGGPDSPFPVGDPGAAARVEPGLLAEVRELASLATGVETVVDCEPSGLALTPARARRLTRCARHLLRSAVATGRVREVDLTVRAEGRNGTPMIYVSVRALAEGGAARVAQGAPGAGARRHRRLVRESGSALLLAHREGDEQRLTLALEMPFEILADRDVPTRSASRVLVADDNPRVRRVARRILEHCGFAVAEAPGAIALLAELDPQGAGAPPDWLLLDEGWLKPPDAEGRGLLSAVEAAMPAGRVVVLSGRDGVAAGAHRRVAKPFGGEELQSTLAAGSPPERKVAAESPYSLSL